MTSCGVAGGGDAGRSISTYDLEFVTSPYIGTFTVGITHSRYHINGMCACEIMFSIHLGISIIEC